MMRPLLLSIVSLLLVDPSPLVVAQNMSLGSDYLTEVPLTVYEAEELSPQNLDYDANLRMFPAHRCWYNDRSVHYYKFRIYAPPTYPDLITMESTAADVPLQKVYFVTTDGTMDGVVGMPILEYHHVDGINYSDFMEIVLVQAPSNYTEDMYKSVADIISSSSSSDALVPTGIIVNMPVVPTNATLQDPAYDEDSDTVSTAQENGFQQVAPINPTMAWYKGVPVWTYVFEVTDQLAADFFASTRADPSDPDYAITVTPYATSESVSAIPLAHVNQYTVGVNDMNFGGPSSTGMRNIINLDRADAGYSPLWQLWWFTQLPINYMADQVSNIADMTEDVGFTYVPTPMFVNCPDIGAIGTRENPFMLQASEFQTEIDTRMEYNTLLGSDASTILMPNVPIDFVVNGEVIGSTETNMMGAYEFNLTTAMIPEMAMMIDVVNANTSETIRSIMMMNASDDDGDGDTGASSAATRMTTASVQSFMAIGMTLSTVFAGAILI